MITVKTFTMAAFFMLTVPQTFASDDNSKEFANKDISHTVSVMSYNVENLFDNKHDAGKNDWSYLSLKDKKTNSDAKDYCDSMNSGHYKETCLKLDWNDNLLKRKIQQLSKVIKSYKSKGPDILVLQEVENINVLRLMVKWGLGSVGLKYIVLLEGPDRRGIDIGFISRYPIVGKAKLHRVDLTSLTDRPTRGILEATFSIKGKKLTVLGNHWPSQRHEDIHRLIAAETLEKIARRIKDSPVVAVGDFNTMPSDAPHGINQVLLDVNNSNGFYDAEWMKTKRRSGTHFYSGKWSSLDRIFVLKRTTKVNGRCSSRSGCLIPHWNSFKIIKNSFQLTNSSSHRGIPYRFDLKTGEGFSDHLPIAMEFSL